MWGSIHIWIFFQSNFLQIEIRRQFSQTPAVFRGNGRGFPLPSGVCSDRISKTRRFSSTSVVRISGAILGRTSLTTIFVPLMQLQCHLKLKKLETRYWLRNCKLTSPRTQQKSHLKSLSLLHFTPWHPKWHNCCIWVLKIGYPWLPLNPSASLSV